jgi:protein phosphatase 1 regulatory subunit 7
LAQHKFLRNLCLRNNKLTKIEGLVSNKTLKILDLSENEIEDVEGLDNLNLTELYLSANKIQIVKGFTKLDKLRVLDLSINDITLLGGLSQLISLRTLLLSKNKIKHVKQMNFLENLAYLSEVDLCYNPIQERRYYRYQIIYKLPMLKVLDGSTVLAEEVVKAENIYGFDVEERHRIYKTILPEEDFIDRRIHTSELIEVESDSAGKLLLNSG